MQLLVLGTIPYQASLDIMWVEKNMKDIIQLIGPITKKFQWILLENEVSLIVALIYYLLLFRYSDY